MRGIQRVPDGVDDGRADQNELIAKWSPPAGQVALDPEHAFMKQFKDKEGEAFDRPINFISMRV